MMKNVEFRRINIIATGKNINELRIAAGLSIKDIQEIFGFNTPQAIYKWVNGICMPTVDNLVILAAILEVTIDEIVITESINKGE